MNTLIMMYVYFDQAGEIKSICPDINSSFADTSKYITTPLTEVEGFLIGKKNPFDYFLKPTIRLGVTSYKITRKQVININYLRSKDAFLTEIPKLLRSSGADIIIENFIDTKKLKISINPEINELIKDGTDQEIEQLTALVNTPEIHLFFTRKNDPYFLIDTISISPKELFANTILHVEYSSDLSNTSVFTKRLINGYGYITR